jgi:hypothetical protein
MNTPGEAISKLYDAAVLWAVGYQSGADVVRAACDALVAGADSPSLRALAGVSTRHADTGLRDILPATFEELELPYYPEGSLESEAAALQVLASRVLTDDLPPRELAAWAHHRFGHTRLPAAESLADLDDEYEGIGYGAFSNGNPDDHLDPRILDAKVLEEARRIANAPLSEVTADGDPL